jgi:hypothetical protein
VGLTIFVNYTLDFTFDYILGILFQYLAITSMKKDLSRNKWIKQAVKADTLSLIAFEVGLFGWMALMRFVFFNPLYMQMSLFTGL